MPKSILRVLLARFDNIKHIFTFWNIIFSLFFFVIFCREHNSLFFSLSLKLILFLLEKKIFFPIESPFSSPQRGSLTSNQFIRLSPVEGLLLDSFSSSSDRVLTRFVDRRFLRPLAVACLQSLLATLASLFLCGSHIQREKGSLNEEKQNGGAK